MKTAIVIFFIVVAAGYQAERCIKAWRQPQIISVNIQLTGKK